MSSRTRTLLLSVIALAALMAVLFVFVLPMADNPEGEGTATTTTKPTSTIEFKPHESTAPITKPTGTTPSKSGIDSVTVTLPDETFIIEPNEKGYLRVKGHETLEKYVSTADYSYLIEELTHITALRMINRAPEHPEDFGFDPKKGCAAKLDVVYDDGKTISFEIGDEAPSREGFYFREGSSDAIYLVDAAFVDTVSQPSTGYLSKLPIAAPATTQTNSGDMAVVRDVVLGGTVRPAQISFQISEEAKTAGENAQIMTGYYLTEPYYRTLKSGTNLLAVTAYSGFVASDIAALHPTDEDLKKFGLDNPYSTCTVSLSIQKTTVSQDEDGNEVTSMSFYNTSPYTIKLGNTLKDDEDSRYAIVYSGDTLIPLVYEIVTSSLPWAEVQYDELSDPLLFFTYIDEIDTFSVTLNNETTAFKLTHYADEEDISKNMKVVANNRRYSTTAFRDVFEAFIGIKRHESTTEKPTGEPELILDIETNTESSPDRHIKLYRRSASTYFVEHDTGELYLVMATDVVDAIALYNSLIQ